MILYRGGMKSQYQISKPTGLNKSAETHPKKQIVQTSIRKQLKIAMTA
jgi:hypothetical protein